MGNEASAGGIRLAEMIKTLRSELQEAQDSVAGESIRFVAEKVELELQVALSQTGKGGGGIKFWVVSADGGYETSTTSTHTFKLTLTPVDAATGGRVAVGHEAEKAAVRK